MTSSNSNKEKVNKTLHKSATRLVLNGRFGPYLAGLIEGNGSIYVPAKNGKIDTQKSFLLTIRFKLKDLPLAEKIKEILTGARSSYHLDIFIQKNTKSVFLVIQDINTVWYIVLLTCGFFRTPKLVDYITLVNYLQLTAQNTRNSEFFNKITEFKANMRWNILDLSEIESNSWLAGVVDSSTGNFYVNQVQGNSVKFILNFRMEAKQNFYKETLNSFPDFNRSMFPIMSKLARYFRVNLYLKERSRCIDNRIDYQFALATFNRTNNQKVIDYFYKFPLFSSKRLDFLTWVEIKRIVESQTFSPLSKLLVKHIQCLIYQINDRRTMFRWNHLKYLGKV
uniref:Putative site-specific DNA endonuclease n=1 Tax=Oltmannsiellopsis viridis TaxID=51324 RepID=Q0QIP1_OLTVI|nr:putative site-specific DNA endonuclease [Oltmannsiellopsis viridis]ABC96362.1 putative site-specific DNA endonuclease [Oltmannsiellopsis viridis]